MWTNDLDMGLQVSYTVVYDSVQYITRKELNVRIFYSYFNFLTYVPCNRAMTSTYRGPRPSFF